MPRSPWLAPGRSGTYPSLAGTIDAEVVVVGAGIAGSSAAKVTTLDGAKYRPLEAEHGMPVARAYAMANRAGLDLLLSLLAELAVGADVECRSAITYTAQPEAVSDLQEEAVRRGSARR